MFVDNDMKTEVYFPAETSSARPKTILLVEDEVSVREIEIQLLGSAGYRVLAAEDARGANQLFGDHCAEIDLLLADMIFPGSTGVELYREFKKTNPALKAIIVSGGLREDCGLGGEIAFLQKPYRMSALIKKVKDAI